MKKIFFLLVAVICSISMSWADNYSQEVLTSTIGWNGDYKFSAEKLNDTQSRFIIEAVGEETFTGFYQMQLRNLGNGTIGKTIWDPNDADFSDASKFSVSEDGKTAIITTTWTSFPTSDINIYLVMRRNNSQGGSDILGNDILNISLLPSTKDYVITVYADFTPNVYAFAPGNWNNAAWDNAPAMTADANHPGKYTLTIENAPAENVQIIFKNGNKQSADIAISGDACFSLTSSDNVTATQTEAHTYGDVTVYVYTEDNTPHIYWWHGTNVSKNAVPAGYASSPAMNALGITNWYYYTFTDADLTDGVDYLIAYDVTDPNHKSGNKNTTSETHVNWDPETFKPVIGANYSDITIKVQSDEAPLIYYWGGGNRVENIEWNESKTMTAVPHVEAGWYEYTIANVDDVFGINYIIRAHNAQSANQFTMKDVCLSAVYHSDWNDNKVELTGADCPVNLNTSPYCETLIGHLCEENANQDSYVLLSIGSDGEGHTIVNIKQAAGKNSQKFDYLQVTGLASTGFDLPSSIEGVTELGVSFNTPATDEDGNITLEILWSTIGWPGRWMVSNIKVPADALCDVATEVAAPTYSATIHISAAEYTTYHNADFAYIMPEGCEGYTFSTANGLNKVFDAGNVVAANIPLVIKGTEGDKTLVFAAGGAGVEGNALLGSGNGLTAAEMAAKGANGAKFYALSLNAAEELNSVGFYWFADEGAAFDIPANKAFLVVNPAAGAPARASYVFGQADTATDIEAVEAESAVKFMENGVLYIKKNGVVYNAMGQVIR